MSPAQQLWTKWVDQPQKVIRGKLPQTTLQNSGVLGKVTQTKRKSPKGAGPTIQAMLRGCSIKEQFERDVAMWYGYCSSDSRGARLMLKLFSLIKKRGVLYRNTQGTWADIQSHAQLKDMPVAAMLSHGGRVLFQLPMSNSAARVGGHKVGAFLKGLTIDPVRALVNRGTFHTMRGKSTTAAVAGHFLVRSVGLASAASVLATPSKVYDAGDNRFWHWVTGGNMHYRVAATHSTLRTDWQDGSPNPKIDLGFKRRLWFTEEKAGKLSNFADAGMGRHHYKNVALGGLKNINPFSGVTVDKGGAHGHLYINYRPPSYHQFGCMLVGVEGSAPGKDNQYGKAHTAQAIKGEFSGTGGQKWDTIFPNTFYRAPDKQDVTIFVCDLSDLNTSAAMSITPLNQSDLDKKMNGVTTANWTVVSKRSGLNIS